jgi:hypothetical protein
VPGIDAKDNAKESIPPAYVAWRVGTKIPISCLYRPARLRRLAESIPWHSISFFTVEGYHSQVILILLDGPFKIINIFFQIPVILAVQEYYQAIMFLFTGIFNTQGTVFMLHE